MIKHLYANGCSMAEGCELGNVEFNFDEKAHYCGPYSNRQFLKHLTSIQPGHDRNGHLAHMFEKSWPKLLANKLEIPFCTNAAFSGASNARILRTTIADVTRLLERYKSDEILVAIGWSGLTRYEVLHERTWWSVSPTFSKNEVPNPDLVKMCNIHNKWLVSNLKYILTLHFMQIAQLRDFLINRGIKYVFSYGIANALTNDWSAHECELAAWDSDLQSLFKAAHIGENWVFNDPNDSLVAPMTLGTFIKNVTHKAFYDYSNDHGFKFGNGLHPLEEAHDAWATELFNFIQSQELTCSS